MAEVNMMQEALKYAAMGLAVFPVNPRNKKPHTPNGCLDAKTDPGAIKFWWTKWKKAAIGIATGSISGGLVVVDLDEDEDKGLDGYSELKKWEKEHGQFPETWQSITGRGGYHIFFKSKKRFTNRTAVLEGVDVRGEGGYIIAPPSLHPNNRRYEWEISPEETHLAEVTPSVEALLTYGAPKEGEAAHFELPEEIHSGQRNATLFKYACSLQSRATPNDAIVDYVKLANERRCNPPLDDEEIETLIGSALQYDKGNGMKVPSFSGWHEPVIRKKEAIRNGKTVMEAIQSIENCEQAIMYDKELFQRIKMNDLAYMPYVCGEVPWDKRKVLREWSNEDDACVQLYLEKEYGLKQKEQIMTALVTVTHKNRCHPVREFLEQMHRDYIEAGQPSGQIRRLMPEYLKADDTDYTFAVMRIFMLGAISRVYHPGVKFDYVPIISGDQGAGKSVFCRWLAMNDDWFSDNFNTMESDKASEKLTGKWILELAELLAAKRTKDVEGIKAFLTSTVDSYRPPYNRRVENRPRQCVFIGTTNSGQFLTDRTGNRRFLPVQIHGTRDYFQQFNKLEIQKAMRLAWGEAMQIFKDANESPELVLTGSVAEAAERMQERFAEEDPNVGIIQDWLDHNKGGENGTLTCSGEIWEKAFGGTKASRTAKDVNMINDIMRTKIKGWKQTKGRVYISGYGNQRGYELMENEPGFLDQNDSDEVVPFS